MNKINKQDKKTKPLLNSNKFIQPRREIQSSVFQSYKTKTKKATTINQIFRHPDNISAFGPPSKAVNTEVAMRGPSRDRNSRKLFRCIYYIYIRAPSD